MFTHKRNKADIVLQTATLILLLVAVFFVLMTPARSAPAGTQATVKVIYLDPDTVARVQAAVQAKRDADAAYEVLEKQVGEQFAQAANAKPDGTFIYSSNSTFQSINQYWQDVGPRAPSPADDHHWLTGWEWGFQFLDDFSGIVPLKPPAGTEEKSATIQLFKR